MKLNIGICDDCSADRERLRQLLQEVLTEEGLAAAVFDFENGEALVASIEACPDTLQIVFLDIILDNLNGIELVERLRQQHMQTLIIFVSSSMDFALRGYEVTAERYLLKPVQKDVLREALLHSYQHLCGKRTMLIGRHRQVDIDDIVYIEVNGRGTRLHLGQEVVDWNAKISALEDELSGRNFVRCHQSFLVNLRFVREIERYELRLHSDICLPVSKMRYVETRDKLLAYLSR